MADWATVEQGADMRDHMARMVAMRRSMLWCQWLTIGLGAWLATSPFQFALFDPATAASGARDITIERGLWNAATRNAITGWNDVTCGVLLMLLGALTLKARFERWQWATCAVGLWLLFAPLAFWTPSSAAYVNDTMIGALAIALSVLIPMMPGMNMDGMMDESDQPPGWSYAPSSWPQRLPIIALGALGYLIARYITAYQMGYTPALWDPFFAGQGGLNGSEYIVTSHVSKAWPIADGGLGATSYMLEVLMGAMGSAKRWRTMPWMVTFFFILVVPLGGVSIGFIIIQPIMLGTYCTLCLVQAFAMLLMIPLALDEVVAMGQYMKRSAKAGRPLIRTFFQGGPDPDAIAAKGQDYAQAPGTVLRTGLRGVSAPVPLLAVCSLGVWLMGSRAVLGTVGAAANSDHLVGALLLTISVCATAEPFRALRFLNIPLALWLLAAPWALDGGSAGATVSDLAAGIAVAALSLPRGSIAERFGEWRRVIV